jgi:tetratricopeptide (TPR) repeat protein
MIAGSSAEALHDEGKQLFGAGDYSGADRCFSLAIEAAPPVPGNVGGHDLLRKMFANRGRARHNLARYEEAIADLGSAYRLSVKQDDKANLQRLAHESANQLLFSRLCASGKDAALEALAALPLDDAHRTLQIVRLACAPFSTSAIIDKAADLVASRYGAIPEFRRPKLCAKDESATWTNISAPNTAVEWYKLGRSLTSLRESASCGHRFNVVRRIGEALPEAPVRGQKYTGPECFVKTLELEPRFILAWNELGRSGLEVVVSGQRYTPPECFVKALELDVRIPETWCNLGVVLAPGDEVTVFGQKFTKHEAFVNAINLDARIGLEWSNLGVALTPGQIVTVNGLRYNNLQCFVKALEIDPGLTPAWSSIGSKLGPGNEITVRGQIYTDRQCSTKVVELDPACAWAWADYGSI